MSVLRKPITEDHLLAIFTRVSLATLLRLPLVCVHWAALQTVACRHIHTLTLSIGGISTEYYTRNQSPISASLFTKSTPIRGLPLTQITIHQPDGNLFALLVRTLLSLFPTIRNFYFEYTRKPLQLAQRVNRVNDLLLGWARSLIRLGVYGFEAEYYSKEKQRHTSSFLRTLLAIINTLPVLKHLTIDLKSGFFPTFSKTSNLPLSILARLRSFSLNSRDDSDIFLSSLLTFSSSLHEIGFGPFSRFNYTTSMALENSPLLPKITHYNYITPINSWDTKPSPKLSFIVTHFTNLSFLRLSIFKSSGYSLCQLFQMLLKLNHLRILHMFLELESIPLGDLSDIPSLPTVTSFSLYLGKFLSNSVLANRLPLVLVLFPNLEVIYLKYGSYRQNLCSSDCKTAYTGPCTACVRLWLAPLKGCTKLKKIFTKIEEYPKIFKHEFHIDEL